MGSLLYPHCGGAQRQRSLLRARSVHPPSLSAASALATRHQTLRGHEDLSGCGVLFPSSVEGLPLRPGSKVTTSGDSSASRSLDKLTWHALVHAVSCQAERRSICGGLKLTRRIMPLKQHALFFDPQILTVMETALEKAWDELRSQHDIADTSEITRQKLARTIVALAAVGEAEPHKLERSALGAYRSARRQREAARQVTANRTNLPGSVELTPCRRRYKPEPREMGWRLTVPIGLIALGLIHVANGCYMLIDPAGWYELVPGVVNTGPFNSHFVRDIGLTFVASGAGLMLGVSRAPWSAAFALAGATWPALHAGLHVFDWIKHGFASDIRVIISEAAVVMGLGLIGVLLAALRAREERWRC
jgi:hypothetical protein